MFSSTSNTGFFKLAAQTFSHFMNHYWALIKWLTIKENYSNEGEYTHIFFVNMVSMKYCYLWKISFHLCVNFQGLRNTTVFGSHNLIHLKHWLLHGVSLSLSWRFSAFTISINVHFNCILGTWFHIISLQRSSAFL